MPRKFPGLFIFNRSLNRNYLLKNTTLRVFVLNNGVVYLSRFFIGYWILKRGRISIQPPVFLYPLWLPLYSIMYHENKLSQKLPHFFKNK
jgi:hypothetical protein